MSTKPSFPSIGDLLYNFLIKREKNDHVHYLLANISITYLISKPSSWASYLYHNNLALSKTICVIWQVNICQAFLFKFTSSFSKSFITIFIHVTLSLPNFSTNLRHKVSLPGWVSHHKVKDDCHVSLPPFNHCLPTQLNIQLINFSKW